MSAERPGYPNQPSYPPTQQTPGGSYGTPASGQEPDPRSTNGADQFPGEPQPGSPAETAAFVRGLHAWMSDLDHKIAIRTKLLLALVAVAIGIAGAALYLAVEANRTTASQQEFAELQLQVEELQEQLGVVPTETELEDAEGAIEGAAEDADAAAESADQAADDADAAAGAAEDAAGAADEAERSATEESDASAIIEEAMKERFDELNDGAPPMPEIGTN